MTDQSTETKRTVRVVNLESDDAWPKYELKPGEEILDATAERWNTSHAGTYYRQRLRLVVLSSE